jgi:hypothetical protein
MWNAQNIVNALQFNQDLLDRPANNAKYKNEKVMYSRFKVQSLIRSKCYLDFKFFFKSFY